MEMMTLVGIFHIVVALLLIVLVLLQDPKGGGAAGMFGGGGGSQNSFFGASGAGNFLTTLTKWFAVIFAVTSIGMTYMTSHKGGSVMDEFVPEAAVPMDSLPEGAGGMDTGAPAEEKTEDSPETKAE